MACVHQKSLSSVGMASMVRLDNRGARTLFVGLLAALAAGTLLNCRLDASRQGWSRRWGPVVPHQSFPGDCGLCHVTERWDVLRKDFSFDHEKQTGYRLQGAHTEAACLPSVAISSGGVLPTTGMRRSGASGS